MVFPSIVLEMLCRGCRIPNNALKYAEASFNAGPVKENAIGGWAVLQSIGPPSAAAVSSTLSNRFISILVHFGVKMEYMRRHTTSKPISCGNRIASNGSNCPFGAPLLPKDSSTGHKSHQKCTYRCAAALGKVRFWSPVQREPLLPVRWGAESLEAAARFSSEALKTSFNLPRFRGRAPSSAAGHQALFPGKAGLLSHLLFDGWLADSATINIYMYRERACSPGYVPI